MLNQEKEARKLLKNVKMSADAELDAVEAHLVTMRTRLEGIPAELSSLAARARVRETQLEVAQSAADEARSDLVSQRANVDVGLADSESMAAFEKDLARAEKLLQATKDRCNAQQVQDDRQAETLKTEQERLARDLDDMTIRQRALETAKREAHQETGRIEYRHRLDSLDSLQSLVELKKKELHLAEQAAKDARNEAVEALRPWPELQRHLIPVKEKKVYSDVHTDLLEANISLLDAVLELIAKESPTYAPAAYGNLVGLNCNELSVPCQRGLELRRNALKDYLERHRREGSR